MHVGAYERLGRQALVTRWRELMEDPDAPERCELDEFGEVRVNPPPSFRHRRIVSALARQIEGKLGGDTGSYALWTPSGIRFPDICWAPNFDDLARSGGSDPLVLSLIGVMEPGMIGILEPVSEG